MEEHHDPQDDRPLTREDVHNALSYEDLMRVQEMQRDLAFLFSVNWVGVDRRLKVRVLKHAVRVLRGKDD